jgi:tetratricopeptide (TPR) repeat protein
MNQQFGDLTQAAQACLDAAHLLGRAGIAPLTRRRLAAVQAERLGRSQSGPQLSAALEELGDHGLLTSSLADELDIRVPNGLLQPNDAGAASLTETDFVLLIRALAPLDDFEGLHGLAQRRFENGSPEQALHITLAILDWLTAQAPFNFPEEHARGLHNAGVCLVVLGRLEEALPYFEQDIERFAASMDENVSKHVAAAMYGKYYTLYRLRNVGEASTAFEVLTERFSGDSSPAVRSLLLKAYSTRANDLFEAGAASEAFAIYHTIDVQFGDDNEPAVSERVAFSMLTHARAGIGKQVY